MKEFGENFAFRVLNAGCIAAIAIGGTVVLKVLAGMLGWHGLASMAAS